MQLGRAPVSVSHLHLGMHPRSQDRELSVFLDLVEVR